MKTSKMVLYLAIALFIDAISNSLFHGPLTGCVLIAGITMMFYAKTNVQMAIALLAGLLVSHSSPVFGATLGAFLLIGLSIRLLRSFVQFPVVLMSLALLLFYAVQYVIFALVGALLPSLYWTIWQICGNIIILVMIAFYASLQSSSRVIAGRF